jgi:hypothetical protein
VDKGNTVYGKITKNKITRCTQDMLHQIKRVSIFRIPIFSMNHKILNHQVCLLDMHQTSRDQIHLCIFHYRQNIILE